MAEDWLRRTAVTRIRPSEEQRRLLERTVDEWRFGANIAVDVGERVDETAKTKLQSLAYETVREKTALGSQHAILATHRAAKALRGVATRRREGYEATTPQFTSPTIPYDSRSMTLFEDEQEVSLLTVDGRVRCPICLPEEEDGYQWAYLDEWEQTESTLTVCGDEWFLHLGFRKPHERTPDDIAENRTVLGVDLGIENVAVTSTALFESAAELTHRREEFQKTREGLQRTGTRSAHLTLTERRNREERYARDYLHRTANRIVREAETYSCRVIVFEDLTHIRDALPNDLSFHRWAHRRLVEYVTYKARERGMEVAFVDPANTSKMCSECGHVSRSNRPTRDRFSCGRCDTTANADYNAAKNVGLRYVRSGQQSSDRTGECRLALKSGTVTPNRGFTPYPSGSEAETTDKSGT